MTGTQKARVIPRSQVTVYEDGASLVLVVVLMLAGACNSSSDGVKSYPTPVVLDAGSNPAPAPVRDAAGTDNLIEPDDTAGLAALLRDGILPGWIHGAVSDRTLYVFTYRKPGDFFDFAELPLKPASDDITAQLMTIKRHDAVLIGGSFIQDGAPIRHILITKLTIVTPYVADEVAATPHQAQTEIPDDLVGQTELLGKVHAVDTDGRILVIEYGDAVIPVFVPAPMWTAGLYRNDKIRLAFQFAPIPPKPTHLWLDTAAAKPLEVLERLVDQQGKIVDEEGSLVRFPQSPEIVTDIYAVQVVDADNISREYTLLNQDSQVIFNAIHAKLAAAWKSRPGQGIDGRNKLVNPFIRVHAHGTFNLVAPNQANAQVLLDTADDVTVTLLP